MRALSLDMTGDKQFQRQMKEAAMLEATTSPLVKTAGMTAKPWSGDTGSKGKTRRRRVPPTGVSYERFKSAYVKALGNGD